MRTANLQSSSAAQNSVLCAVNPQSSFEFSDVDELILADAVQSVSVKLLSEEDYKKIVKEVESDDFDDDLDIALDGMDTRSNTGAKSLSDADGANEDFGYKHDEIDPNDFYRQRGSMKYLNNIDTHSLLKPEEEISLAKRIKSGDKDALELLIRSNLKLVVSVVKKHIRRGGMEFDDLVQEGNLGVMRAAEKFDPERGLRFSTYAVYWIRQHILRAFKSKSSLIYIPAHVSERIYTARKNLDVGIKSETSSEADIEKLKECLATTINKELGGQLHLIHNGQDIQSLDSNPSGDDDMPSIGELLEAHGQDPSRRYEMVQCIEMMSKALEAIECPRDREIFKLRSGLNEDLEGYSLDEVGQEFSLTRERVRQIYIKVKPAFLAELTKLSGGLHNLPMRVSF